MSDNLVIVRKQLFLQAQVQLRALGIIMKKVPISLLKKAAGVGTVKDRELDALDMWHDLGMDGHRGNEVVSWARNPVFKNYVKEVLAGMPWSQHPNVYFAFGVDRGNDYKHRRGTRPALGHYRTSLELLGMITTGTFQQNRIEDDRRFVLDPACNYNKAAELEVVVARPQRKIGKALALFGLADLLSRKSQGTLRYENVFTLPINASAQRFFTDLGFELEDASEVDQMTGEVTESNEIIMRFKGGIRNVTALSRELENDSEGLFKLCPTGPSVPLWQRCR